jgi:hypothetical protein
MPKELLTSDEIIHLSNLLRQTYKFISDLSISDPLAKRLKYPQIPPILSESLAIRLLKNGKILKNKLNNYSFNFGGNVADILATFGEETIKIEVKATGAKAFQYFSDKDTDADYIIWLHFGEFFSKAEDLPIEVYLISKPKRYFPNHKKITLPVVKRIVVDIEETKITLSNI